MLDDALLSSAVSNEGIVLGALRHCWRMLSGPVLALSAAGAATYGLLVAAPAAWWVALLLAVLFGALTLAGGYAGAACLTLLLLMLGRGQGPLAPSFGAAQIVLLQAALAVAVVLSSANVVEGDDEHVATWAVLVIGLVLCATLSWLAHRVPVLSAIAAYAPLALVLLLLVLLSLIVSYSAADLGAGLAAFAYAWILLPFVAVVPAGT